MWGGYQDPYQDKEERIGTHIKIKKNRKMILGLIMRQRRKICGNWKMCQIKEEMKEGKWICIKTREKKKLKATP